MLRLPGISLLVFVLAACNSAPNVSQGSQELGAAVIAGDLKEVKALLATGADPNSEVSFTKPTFNRGRELDTRVLLAAVVYRHPEIVDMLIRHNVALKMYWNAFAICAAVNTRQGKVVAALIKAGIEVNPNFTCIRGLSPLESAQQRGFGEIEYMLVVAGAK